MSSAIRSASSSVILLPETAASRRNGRNRCSSRTGSISSREMETRTSFSVDSMVIIRVDFTKKGVDAVAVYCRLRGTAAWVKIGTDSGSPYYDTAPPANANVPEVREYMGMGVLDDVEIGLPRDIVSITLS